MSSSKWPPRFPWFCQLLCRMETSYSHTRTKAKRGSTVAPGLQMAVLVPLRQTVTSESSHRASQEHMSHMCADILVGVGEQLDQPAVQRGGRVQQHPVQAVLPAAQLGRHWGGRRPRLQVPCEGQKALEHRRGRLQVKQQHNRRGHLQPRTTIRITYNQEPPSTPPTTKNHHQHQLQPRTTITCNQEPPSTPPTSKNHHHL